MDSSNRNGWNIRERYIAHYYFYRNCGYYLHSSLDGNERSLSGSTRRSSDRFHALTNCTGRTRSVRYLRYYYRYPGRHSSTIRQHGTVDYNVRNRRNHYQPFFANFRLSLFATMSVVFVFCGTLAVAYSQGWDIDAVTQMCVAGVIAVAVEHLVHIE